MKDTDITTVKNTSHPLFPEIDTGIHMLAYYLRQYVQNLRQLEKRPAPAAAAR